MYLSIKSNSTCPLWPNRITHYIMRSSLISIFLLLQFIEMELIFKFFQQQLILIITED